MENPLPPPPPPPPSSPPPPWKHDNDPLVPDSMETAPSNDQDSNQEMDTDDDPPQSQSPPHDSYSASVFASSASVPVPMENHPDWEPRPLISGYWGASASDLSLRTPTRPPLPPRLSPLPPSPDSESDPFLQDPMYYQDWDQEIDTDADALQQREDAYYALLEDVNALLEDTDEVLDDADLFDLDFIFHVLQEDPSALEDIDVEEILAEQGISEGHPDWDIWRPHVEAHHALRAAVPAVIERLHNITVDASFLEDENTRDLECAVCREKFVEEESLKRLDCFHYYHATCILQWLEIRNTCPVCRYQLPREIQP